VNPVGIATAAATIAMTDKRTKRPIHGWIVLDKPIGLSSSAAVGRVRHAIAAAKAGHAGTLDPLATGVLPIALGEATKTAGYLMDRRKHYRVAVRWGEQRDTDDAEGAVIATSNVRPAPDAIDAALCRFRGEIEQVPPRYSAVKVDGRRAYAIARASQPVALSPRLVTVETFALVDRPDADHAVFEVTGGKGVYMRALARDLAIALGTVGYVAWLRRSAVGPFDESRAVPLTEVEAAARDGDLTRVLLPVTAALAGIPALALTEAEARRLQQGQPVAALPVARRSSLKGVARETVMFAAAEGRPVALARIKGGEIRPVRVLNLF
jgi:tRNA pseudouridine55 synthase